VPDDLLRRFAQLNPVPDPDLFALHGDPSVPVHPVLRAVLAQARAANGRHPTQHARPPQMEVTTMSTSSPPRLHQDPPTTRGSTRRWVLVAGAVVVVVGALVGFLTLDSDEGPAVAAGEEGSAGAQVDEGPGAAAVDPETAIARAYIEARNAYDADRARALVSEDFATTEAPDGFRNLATMDLAFATHEAYGFRYTDGECLAPRVGPQGGVFVHCEYQWTTELQRITGYPPVPVRFTFRIEDDRISRIAHDWNPSEFGPNVYDPWIAFLTEEYPDFAGLALAIHRLDPGRTPEAVQQLPEHLELYEQWVRAHGA
jgi:hypothetical protein